MVRFMAIEGDNEGEGVYRVYPRPGGGGRDPRAALDLLQQGGEARPADQDDQDKDSLHGAQQCQVRRDFP